MYEYRIEFSIQRKADTDDEYVEVGFGSSGACGTVDDAAYQVEPVVQNRMWETEPGQPDPDTVDPKEARHA